MNLDHYNLQAVAGAQDINTTIRAEEEKIANDGKYEWMPVAKVGLNFKF